MSHMNSQKSKASLTYDTAFSKGRQLIELMRSQPESHDDSSAAPNFTVADLDKWGYVS